MKRVFYLVFASIWLFVLPIQQKASAQVEEYLEWTGGAKEYHLYDDVRTISFSHSVSEESLLPEGGVKPITVWDVTNPDEKKAVQVELAVDENDQKKVMVRLADGAQYIDGHKYSLLIEKGITPTTVKATLKNPIKYNFTMVYKHPEVVKFAESYRLMNHSDEMKTINLPEKAYYISLDSYGSVKGQSTNSSYVILKPSEEAIVSYLAKPSSGFSLPDGVTVEKSTDSAYTGMKLYKNNSVETTNMDEFSPMYVYKGNHEGTSVYSSSLYPKKDTHATATYQQRVNHDLEKDNLYPGDQVVVTNDVLEPLYVFSPNTSLNLSKTMEIDESAVVALKANPGERLHITSNETSSFSQFKLRETSNKGSYSYANYTGESTAEQLLNKSVYGFGDDTLSVKSVGDSLLENTGKYSMTAYGPSRYLSFEKTDEELFTMYTLESGQSVRMTSSEGTSYSRVNLRDISKKGSFSYSIYKEGRLEDGKYHSGIYSSGDDSLTIWKDYDTVLKNTGKTEQTLYGLKRFISIDSTNEQPYRTIVLKPGEKVQATTTAKDYSQVGILDSTKRGQFTATVQTSSGILDYDRKLTSGADDMTVWKGYETVVENTGATDIIVYGNERFVKLK